MEETTSNTQMPTAGEGIVTTTTAMGVSSGAAPGSGGAPTATPTTTTQQPATASNSAPNSMPNSCANVVTIPVPIVQNEEIYTYITVKGSLHDRSCTVFGLNETEVQALSKRFGSGVKGAVNGVMVSISPMEMVNTVAQLGYKVVCSCGEAEISWTMQREI